jgi:hypothetical protein
MTPLTESILAGISQDNEKAFLAAEESAMAYAFGMAPNVGLIEPYQTLITEQPPGAEDIDAIKMALLDYLNGKGRKRYAVTAIFALGKIQDPGLIEPLKEQLELHLRELLARNAIVGNLICALSNLGEPIISGKGHRCTEIDKTVRDARTYLYGHGVIVPW